MTAREVLDGINTRLAAASPAPWFPAVGHTADDSEPVITYEQKTAFLEASLNDDESKLWLVHNDQVIPAATGDGPRAQANAEFIAAAPVDVARLTRAVEEALSWAEKFETNQSSDIAKRQDAQFDLGYSAGRRAAGNILRVVIENALNPKEGQ